MTNVRQRLVAVLAAFALVVGCGLLMATPQQAHADTLTAGSTLRTAKAMPLLNKNLKAVDNGSFSSKQIYKCYKFVTSNRASAYRVRVKSVDGEDIRVNFYDDSGHVMDGNFETSGAKTRKFYELDRNTTYYIELNRYTNGSAKADYVITIQEHVTPPDTPTSCYLWSKAKRTLRVTYKKCEGASGYQIAYRKGSSGKWTYKTTKKTSYVIKNLRKNKRYSVKVRPYVTVYKKNHYGDWTNVMKAKPNGKKHKYYA